MKRLYPPHTRFENGFTLIEVIVTMALFMTILIIAGTAFNKVVSQAATYSKIEESNIEGVIGLEVMRHDLAQMGFGLPWGFSQGDAVPPTTLIDSTITYEEATDTSAAALNDSPGGVPRAFAGFAAYGNFAADYIAVKGTNVGRSKASQRWTYMSFQNYSANPRETRPVSFSSNNPQSGDQVVFINSNSNDLVNKDHRLIVYPSNPASFSTGFSSTNGIVSSFVPVSMDSTYLVYGVDDSSLRMPFNRADFFIGTATSGTVPPFCAPTTGVLYKATVNHNGGGYTYLPLLDCVADMQVVLGWDTSDSGISGAVDAYSSLPQSSNGSVTATPSSAAASIQGWLTDPKGIREHLKVVKVYILAQEGKFDSRYSAPTTSITVGDLLADGFRTKADYVLSTAQQKYRWKLYRIAVRPKNLVSNQR